MPVYSRGPGHFLVGCARLGKKIGRASLLSDTCAHIFSVSGSLGTDLYPGERVAWPLSTSPGQGPGKTMAGPTGGFGDAISRGPDPLPSPTRPGPRYRLSS